MEWFPSDPVLNFLSGVRVWPQVWLSFIGDVQFDVSNDEWSLVLERTGTEAQHKYSEAHHGHHQRQQHRDLESGGSVEFSHGRGSKSEGPDGNHAGRRSLRSLLDRSCFFTRPPNQPASLTHPYLSRDSLCCRGSLPPHCACVPEASTFRGRSRFRCGRGAGRVMRGFACRHDDYMYRRRQPACSRYYDHRSAMRCRRGRLCLPSFAARERTVKIIGYHPHGWNRRQRSKTQASAKANTHTHNLFRR